MRSTKIDDTAKERLGRLKNMAANPARNAARIPINKNPPMKVKFLRVVNTYADRPRKIEPVVAIAVNTICPPCGIDKYILMIGPSVYPMKPVNTKTKTNPNEWSLYFVVRNNNPKKPPSVSKIPGCGNLRSSDTPAVSALNKSVNESKK